jgi:hypothetical protein
MREIKFNAVNPDNHDEYIIYNEWLEENDSPHNDGHESMAEFLSFYFGFILLQYTGLKDKSGKESYIGDICKDNEDEVFYIMQDAVLIYGKYNDVDVLVFGWDIMDSSQFEVIGNIYENPELLMKD